MPTRTSWSQYLQPRLAVMVSTERSNILLNAPKIFRVLENIGEVNLGFNLNFSLAPLIRE